MSCCGSKRRDIPRATTAARPGAPAPNRAASAASRAAVPAVPPRARPAAAATPASPPARPASPPARRNPNVTYFLYYGATAMTVQGPRSGKRYRFDRPGAIVEVDLADAPSLARVAHLRQVAAPPAR